MFKTKKLMVDIRKWMSKAEIVFGLRCAVTR